MDSRRWWRVVFILLPFLFCLLPYTRIHIWVWDSTGRSGIDFRGCIPFQFPEFASHGVGVSLVHPYSIRYPVWTLVSWTANTKNEFSQEISRHTRFQKELPSPPIKKRRYYGLEGRRTRRDGRERASLGTD